MCAAAAAQGGGVRNQKIRKYREYSIDTIFHFFPTTTWGGTTRQVYDIVLNTRTYVCAAYDTVLYRTRVL